MAKPRATTLLFSDKETAWLERYRQRWDDRFDALDTVVEELTRRGEER